MTWTEDVSSRPVSEVAAALGLTSGRSHSLGPCPGCGASERGGGDRRGPIGLTRDGAGWRCHRCEAGGSALDLVAVQLFRARLDKGDHRWGALRERCTQLGLCTPGDSGERSPASRQAPPVRPPRAEVDALWAASARVDRLGPADAAVDLFLQRRKYGPPDVLAALDVVRVTPMVHRWPTWWPQRWAATWRLVCLAYEADGTPASVHARAVVSELAEGQSKTRWPSGSDEVPAEARRLLFASPAGVKLLRGEAPPKVRVVVGEGLTGMVNASLRAREHGDRVAVLCATSGGFGALEDVRWPTDATVYVATDSDAAGERYAQQIREAIPAQVVVRRARWDTEGDRDLGDCTDAEFVEALKAAQPMSVGPVESSGGQAEQVVDTTAEDALEDLRALVAAVGSAQGKGDQRELVAKFLEGSAPRGLALLEDSAPIAAALVRLRVVGSDVVTSIERAIRAAEPPSNVVILPRRGSPAGRREIKDGVDMAEITDQAVAALSDSPKLFQRAGELVTVAARRGRPVIAPVAPPYLRLLLGEAATWLKLKRQGDAFVEAKILPPPWVVETIATLPEWPGVPELEGLLTHPTVRADGSLLAAAGYDPASGLLLVLPTGLRVSVDPEPRLDDAQAALERLRELFFDFPFEADHHRDAAISALLTLVARPGIDGPVPLFLFSATAARTGKSKLVDAISYAVYGSAAPRMAFPADDDAEQRKTITSIARSGAGLALFDNVEAVFGGPAIDAALTSTMWSDRKMREQEIIELPWRTALFVTLNGPRMKGDIVKRTIPVALDAKMEHPEQRTGFRHPKILSYSLSNRGKILGDALTIMRAFFEAGAPRQNIAPLGGFEEWSSTVRSALVWAGAADPCAGQAALLATGDEAAEQHRIVLAAWYACYQSAEKIVADVADECAAARSTDLSFGNSRRDLYRALEGIPRARRGDGSLDPRAISIWLSRIVKKKAEQLWFDRGGRGHNNVCKWSCHKEDAT